MKQKTEHYNLLVEDWIPVLWNDGKFSRVGIMEALTQAGRIRQIAASNPMDRIAIVRFLLALLYWCKGNRPEEGSFISYDSFPADWFSKLDAYRDRFNLLGEERRFYQDREAQRSRASTDLIQEIPTGNNFWHFRHSTDKTDGLCASCCAMGLLRLPLFSVSGLPDLMAGINGPPPIYVVHWGTSLLDILWANWATCLELGDPTWVSPNISPTAHKEVPLLTGLTLLSRRVWLHRPSEPPGTCAGCGAKEAVLIRTCQFQTAGKQENGLWNDPHVVYLDKTPRKSLKAADLTTTGTFRMDRPWANLLARIAETGKFVCGKKPTSVFIVGFATDRAKNIDVWERTVEVPSSESVQETAISLLRHWHKEGGRLEKRIGRSKVERETTIAAIRPHIEDSVSAKAGELLAEGEDSWEQAAREYRTMMAVIARSLSPGFTTASVLRRQKIAYLMPNMGQKKQKLIRSLVGTEEGTDECNGSVH
ncbi:MAG: type I-E CRISPR-associated protein Cse1/CasA [Desulfomonile sp.]